MDFESASVRANELLQVYAARSVARGDQPWDASALLMGFMGDVGDLSKLVLAREGRRDIADLDAKIRHELADCLWSVLVLSDQLGVDLERAFVETMSQVSARLEESPTP